MIKIKYRSIFFAVFILVAIALAGGFAYRQYSDNGHILGFRFEKVDKNNAYPTPVYPTVTNVVLPTTLPLSENTKAPVLIPSPTPVPELGIALINYPQSVKLDKTATFTWEITGPASTTGFTAIVASKESQKGNVSANTPLEETGYRVLTREYISGNYATPLVFVGNSLMPEFGTWFFRAFAKLNSGTVWSPEYSLTVM